VDHNESVEGFCSFGAVHSKVICEMKFMSGVFFLRPIILAVSLKVVPVTSDNYHLHVVSKPPPVLSVT
jgi:hypothetical protein